MKLKTTIVFLSLLGFSVGISPQVWLGFWGEILNFFDPNAILEKHFPIFRDNVLYLYKSLSELPIWRLVLIFLTVGYLLHALWIFLFETRLTLKERIILSFFYYLRNAPFIKGYVKVEIDKAKCLVEDSFVSSNCPRKNHALPKNGLTKEEILTECDAHAKMGDGQWRKGRVSGAVYIYELEHKKMLEEVYSKFAETNPLHPDVFPGVRKMDAEIVSMCLNMYHGFNGECGATTSGGTESILMAMKAYREIGYAKGIKYPEIVMAISAHSAFMKAANYFGMRTVRVKVNKNYALDLKALEKAINNSTIVLVASAPSYPHGIIDAVGEVAKLGIKYNIGVHVDCCLGGFLIPFMEEAGYPISMVDFRVDGVTSISCDTHKYGYGPKGCSVIMYKNAELRKNQYFIDTDWSGGIYASPAIAGSRSGVTLACTWAAMMHVGREGYVAKTKQIIAVREEIEKEVRKIPELVVYGHPSVSVLAIGSKTLDIFNISDHLAQKGWHLNMLQFPGAFHICFTAIHIGKNIPEQFISDLKESVEKAQDSNSHINGSSAIYGTTMKIPDRSLVGEVTSTYLNSLYKM